MSQTRERDALEDFVAMKTAETAPDQQLPAVVSPQQQRRDVIGAQDLPRYRNTRKVLETLRVLAAAAGDDFYYRYPVKDRRKGTTSWIEGPNIKLTNDVAREYGNCHVDCDWIDGGTTWLFKARFTDYETGFVLSRLYRTAAAPSRLGGDDTERRLDSAFQIAQSKAERNVVANALQTFVDFTFNEAKNSLVDRIGKNLEAYRRDLLDKLDGKVDLKRVEAVIGRPAREWLAPDIARVRAMGQAIEDGMATWGETFPPLAGEEEPEDSALNKFASGTGLAADPDPGGETPPVPPTGIAAEAEEKLVPRPALAPAALYQQCIDSVLKVATDKKLPDPEDRLVVLDQQVREMWSDRLGADPDFVSQALKAAANVINGKLSVANARKILEARVP